MNNNDFILLVCRKISGEASDVELKELELLLSANPGLAKQYTLLQQYWDHHEYPNHVFVEDALQKVLNKLELPSTGSVVPINNITEERGTKKKIALWSFSIQVAAAACIIAIISIPLFFTNQPKQTNPSQSLASLEKKQNTKGIKSTIQLTDGSKVWLNADSKIQYPAMFEGNTREVYLNGEAFFEVAKNPQKPFIIHLANGTVKVVGTSFNIRAYDNEKVVETSVATGKVAFIPKYKFDSKKQDTVFLTPNNKATYIYSAEKISVVPTLAADDKAWTDGKMIFKAMRLEDIATELERNFGKKVMFADDEAREYIFTGSFQNNTLEEIIYYLSKTKGFYFKITNNELIIAAKDRNL